MLSTSSKSIYLNKLIGMSAASLLLVAQAATSMEEPVNEQDQFTFEAVDINNDDRLSWKELSHPYEDQLSSAGWDQQRVISKFDQNKDNYFNENEYQEFTSSLQNNIEGNKGLATNEGEGLGASDPGDAGWFEFDDVEANNDGVAGWNEISTAYGDQISQAGWEEKDVMNRFDENNNNSLEENEYLLFVADLQGAQNQEQQQGQMARSAGHNKQDAQQSNGQAQNQSQNQSEAQSQASMSSGQQQEAGTVAIVTILAVDNSAQKVSLKDLEDRKVVNLDGEEIGEVEDVVRSTIGNETGLVVSVGGFWDIGDEELYFSMDQFRLEGDQLVLQTRLDADAIEESDAFSYNEENYTSVVEEYQASL